MAAKRILACYPHAQPNDPEIYIAALIGVFARYPLPVVASVSDPVAGLASKSKFLPSVAEVTSACDAADLPRQRKLIEHQRAIESRGRDEEFKQRPGKTFERCMEELRAAGLLSGDGAIVAKRFEPGTVIGARDFEAAVKAHGRPFGAFEVGRNLPYAPR